MAESEPAGEIVLYTTEDGLANVQLRAIDGTAWLSQRDIAGLFQVTPQAITQHVQTIYGDGELTEAATCNDYLQVRTEGAREVTRSVRHYNLDMILAIGYRVRSPRGTQFRRWATTVLAEYLVKGFAMDDAKLKDAPQWDYFDEWLERDVSVGKNYLNENELSELNRVVTMYLDFAEDQARRRQVVTMAEWADKLDAFLQFNGRDLLTNAGGMQAAVAKRLAETRYDEFDAQRRNIESVEADVADFATIEKLGRDAE
ncbi:MULTISPECIES: RhuM family protein [Bacteria]